MGKRLALAAAASPPAKSRRTSKVEDRAFESASVKNRNERLEGDIVAVGDAIRKVPEALYAVLAVLDRRKRPPRARVSPVAFTVPASSPMTCRGQSSSTFWHGPSPPVMRSLAMIFCVQSKSFLTATSNCRN